MTGPHDQSLDSVPPAVGLWVHDICTRFEAAWQKGERPRVADFLADGPGRAALARELVQLDVSYRRRLGEEPSAADYRDLFPAGEPGWLAATVAAAEGGRYRLEGEIARGGMGAVYRATDMVLGREVAVKVLQERFAAGSPQARRFAAESRITARLQHPAIPPVHDVGELADGRPFLAMKLVAGHTLAELLRTRPDPAADRGRLVAAFEVVCQAVAFAHERGVLHRDLKPSNVMVGRFGEVQVMDWGLAKEGGGSPGGRDTEPQSEFDAERTPDNPDGSTANRTRTGEMLGTPAYMPPEQARGDLARIDRRSDVFALGGILGEILTGEPPYSGSGAEVKRKAVAGERPDVFARLGACGADAELVSLCARCLAANPEDRPADAGEVAAAVAAYRAGVEERLRQAELDGERQRVKAAEEQKRRRIQLALLAAMALLVSATTAAAWWYQRDIHRRKAAAARDAEVALQAAAALHDRGWTESMNPKQWGETLRHAARELDRAEALLDGAGQADGLHARLAEVRRQTDEAAADCRFALGIEDCLGDVFEYAGLGRPHQDAARRLVELLRERGLDQPSGRDRLVAWAKLHPLRGSIQALLMFVIAWHPEQPTRDQFIRTAVAIDGGKGAKAWDWFAALAGSAIGFDRLGLGSKDALTRLSADPGADELAPTALALVGRALVKWGDKAVALRRLGAWQARHPYNFWLTVQLAEALQTEPPPHREEAVRYARVAVAIRPDSPRAYTTLAAAYNRNGGHDEALAACRKALAIDPNYARGRTLLAEIKAKLAPLPQAKWP